MGQRSQIYVKVDGELVVANYYQWNFGTRMISRARYGIEYIKEIIKCRPYLLSRNSCDFEKFRRYWDVNFDMKDIVMSHDIFSEWESEDYEDCTFSQFVFDFQDNNDGKLFVLVDTESQTVKYCFTNKDGQRPMNAEQYMYWYEGDWKDNQRLPKQNSCIRNIAKINQLAELLTEDELIEFKNVELLSVK